jgi:hypothetical protein
MDAADPLDAEIHLMHTRFVRAMTKRLPAIPTESRERYFGVLSLLVGKLETDAKPMREILQEMMAEAATVILQEMQR